MNNKKAWLVYLLSPCEMSSEGWSGWQYYSVAFGNTDEEIYNNWIENVKKIYGADLSTELRCTNGYWSCYYPLKKNELPTSVYGDSQELHVEAQYRKHIYSRRTIMTQRNKSNLESLTKEQLIHLISEFDHAYFMIGETLVDQSKGHTPLDKALDDIREYICVLDKYKFYDPHLADRIDFELGKITAEEYRDLVLF